MHPLIQDAKCDFKKLETSFCGIVQSMRDSRVLNRRTDGRTFWWEMPFLAILCATKKWTTPEKQWAWDNPVAWLAVANAFRLIYVHKMRTRLLEITK